MFIIIEYDCKAAEMKGVRVIRDCCVLIYTFNHTTIIPTSLNGAVVAYLEESEFES